MIHKSLIHKRTDRHNEVGNNTQCYDIKCRRISPNSPLFPPPQYNSHQTDMQSQRQQ